MIRKDKITIEELKEIFEVAKEKVLKGNGELYKNVVEKSGKKIDPLAEMAFNMQNLLAISDFEKFILEELGINE